MANVYRDKTTGEKMYPVCNWEKNKHKMYDEYWRAGNLYNDSHYPETLAWRERVKELVSKFDSQIVDNTVYMTWEDMETTRGIIARYDARHKKD